MNQANSATNSYDGMFLRRRSGYDNNYQDDATKGRAIKWGRDVVATEDASLTKTDGCITDQRLVAMKQAIDGSDTALINRIAKAHPDIINQISYNSDINEGATMLSYAIFNNNLDAVNALVANGANVDVMFIVDGVKTTLIYLATCLNNLMMLTNISKQSILHINTKCGGISPLHKASSIGNTEIAKFLIGKGSYINSYSDHSEHHVGGTPLMYAVSSLNVSMVKYLLEAGADVKKGASFYVPNKPAREVDVANALKFYKWFPVDQVGVKTKKFEVLALLSKYGAKVDLKLLQDIKNE